MSNNNNSNMSFEYENEESINQNLKCGICTYPFIHPVETSCHHSFCFKCLNTWLNNSKFTCPTCQELVTKQNIKKITLRSFISILNQLSVICKLCNESRIERGNYSDHVTKKCPKIHVYCKAKDSGCQWTGLREELSIHFESCTFKSEENTIQNEKLVDIPELVEHLLQSSDVHPSAGIFRKEDLDGIITMSVHPNIVISSEYILVRAAIDLITNYRFHTLKLSGHSISPENLPIIAASLTNSRSIKGLDLSKYRIDDRGIKLFAESLPDQTCITYLDLNGNSITDNGMASICDVLRRNRSLTRLVLTRNQIGNEGIRMLANLFYNHEIILEELCIGSNYLITTRCLSSIYTLIKWHRKLTLLQIEDTKISYYSLSLIEMYHKLYFRSALRLVL